MAGIELVHVPFKGAADYTTAVLGAHVDMTFGSVPMALPHIRSGVLRALAATTATRVKALPELPALAEAGLPGKGVCRFPARMRRSRCVSLRTRGQQPISPRRALNAAIYSRAIFSPSRACRKR